MANRTRVKSEMDRRRDLERRGPATYLRRLPRQFSSPAASASADRGQIRAAEIRTAHAIPYLGICLRHADGGDRGGGGTLAGLAHGGVRGFGPRGRQAPLRACGYHPRKVQGNKTGKRKSRTNRGGTMRLGALQPRNSRPARGWGRSNGARRSRKATLHRYEVT